MLIWLGKQLLGQSDRQQTEITGAENGPVFTADIVTGMDDDTRRALRELRKLLPRAADERVAALPAPTPPANEE
jgi:hypothetical protein